MRAEVVTPTWAIDVSGDFRDMHFVNTDFRPTSSEGCVLSVVRNDLQHEMRYDTTSRKTQLWLIGGSVEFTVPADKRRCWDTKSWTYAPYSLEVTTVLSDWVDPVTTTTTCPPPPPAPPGGWPSAGDVPGQCSEPLNPRAYHFHNVVYEPYIRFVK